MFVGARCWCGYFEFIYLLGSGEGWVGELGFEGGIRQGGWVLGEEGLGYVEGMVGMLGYRSEGQSIVGVVRLSLYMQVQV